MSVQTEWEKVSSFSHCCRVTFEKQSTKTEIAPNVVSIARRRLYEGASKCEWELCECEAG